jgi:hypothetical protein
MKAILSYAMRNETNPEVERLNEEGRIFGTNSQSGNVITKLESYYKKWNY